MTKPPSKPLSPARVKQGLPRCPPKGARGARDEAAALQKPKQPNAPPVYAPHPTPLVLQRKSASKQQPQAAKPAPARPTPRAPIPPAALQRASRTPCVSPARKPAALPHAQRQEVKRPAAPPVYRPAVPAAAQRKSATPPAPFRPAPHAAPAPSPLRRGGVAQPKTAPAHARATARARPAPLACRPGSRTVQRMEDRSAQRRGSGIDWNYIVKQLVEARRTNDRYTIKNIEAFCSNELSAEDISMMMHHVEYIEEQRRLSEEMPDDSQYYINLLDNYKTNSEYVTSLQVRGVPGANELDLNYSTSTGGSRVGFEKQIEATEHFDRLGVLRAVEQNQSDKTASNVYVSGDIVIDNGSFNEESKYETLVEVKYWPGYSSWDDQRQQEMREKLLDQLMRLLRTGKKIVLLWLAPMPDDLSKWLKLVVDRSYGRLEVRTHL
jgi:hypothetical protein